MYKILIGVGLMVVVLSFIFWPNSWKGINDFRLGVVTDEGLEMITISPDREMINVLQVSAKEKVWIPGGLGWYNADKLKKVFDQEKKWEKFEEVLRWNYGFLPTKTIYLKNMGDWMETQNLIHSLGGWGWLRFRKLEGQSIFKKEIVGDNIDEVMPRDMADSRLINSDVWIKVLNGSDSSGLASFVANRLSWTGLNVLSIENAPLVETSEVCVLSIRNKLILRKEIEITEQILGKCRQIEDKEISEGEMMVLVGQKLSTMIDYPSYVRSF